MIQLYYKAFFVQSQCILGGDLKILQQVVACVERARDWVAKYTMGEISRGNQPAAVLGEQLAPKVSIESHRQTAAFSRQGPRRRHANDEPGWLKLLSIPASTAVCDLDVFHMRPVLNSGRKQNQSP